MTLRLKADEPLKCMAYSRCSIHELPSTLTSPVVCPVCPGLATLAIPTEESPHGVVSSPFLQEAEGFEGRVKGASILTSDEFCTRPRPPPVSSTRSLAPCWVHFLVDEWSSLSGERSGTGSKAPEMGVAWVPEFPHFPSHWGPTLTYEVCISH